MNKNEEDWRLKKLLELIEKKAVYARASFAKLTATTEQQSMDQSSAAAAAAVAGALWMHNSPLQW